jgi:hypothetical protein
MCGNDESPRAFSAAPARPQAFPLLLRRLLRVEQEQEDHQRE